MTKLEPTYLDQLEQAFHRRPDLEAYDSAKMQAMIARFQGRFSPERLRRLRGVELLEELHGRSTRDCIAYWLEFRDEEDFRARLFGSIRGGSALKFGIYQRAEDGEWYVAGEGKTIQRQLTTAEAVARAEQQRDQLLAAREVIAALPPDPDSEPYRQLPERIEQAAPDLHSLAFLHKYLFLQFPERLDDYHSSEHQWHYLLQMGYTPPEHGLYGAARLFVAAWHQFRERQPVSMPAFTHLLNAVNGPPFRTWRIGTRSGSSRESQWPKMEAGSYVSVGWEELGDLQRIVEGRTGADAKEAIREALARHYPASTPQQRGKETQEFWRFLTHIQEGDRVFAADGQRILAIGKVTGPYQFEAGEVFPHRRSVQWLSREPFNAPDRTGLQTTLYPLDGYPQMLLAGINHLRRAVTSRAAETIATPPPPLHGVLEKIEEELRRKGQVVLYGPPGTGKTWHAMRAAEELASRSTFGRASADLTDAQRRGLHGSDESSQRIWSCTFHPGYGYEEFVDGLRPRPGVGGLQFEPTPGLFRRLCERAEKNRGQLHFLLIDEFNRGDAARIFGELLTLLETDKRGKFFAELPHSRTQFTVPQNVRIIATMNTADRSIALLDTALRRRFGFIELMPDPSVLGEAQVGGVVLRQLLATLNDRLRKHLHQDARNLQVGHAFFQRDGSPLRDFADLRRVLQHEVFPLLQEYCYDRPNSFRDLLGEAFVDESTSEMKSALFSPEGEDDLLDALKKWNPTIVESRPSEPVEDDEEEYADARP